QLDAGGRLLAAREDYHHARLLLAGPLSRIVASGLSEAAQRCHERLREWAMGQEFTAKEAISKETVARSAVYGWLTELHLDGLLEQVSTGRGPNPAVWKMTGQAPQQGASWLPTEERVFGA